MAPQDEGDFSLQRAHSVITQGGGAARFSFLTDKVKRSVFSGGEVVNRGLNVLVLDDLWSLLGD